MEAVRRDLETLRRWRQAAAWAPVVWFPVLIFGLLTGRLGLALSLGLAGIVFAGLSRVVVGSRHCPHCGVLFGRSRAAFDRIWAESGCADCGVSLFELRRGVRGKHAHG